MEVTARAVEAIPRGNLHVGRDDFVALWRLVEHLGEANPADWYVGVSPHSVEASPMRRVMAY
jgi:hypothetical protein